MNLLEHTIRRLLYHTETSGDNLPGLAPAQLPELVGEVGGELLGLLQPLVTPEVPHLGLPRGQGVGRPLLVLRFQVSNQEQEEAGVQVEGNGQEAGGRRQKAAGGRRQEAGGRRQEKPGASMWAVVKQDCRCRSPRPQALHC